MASRDIVEEITLCDFKKSLTYIETSSFTSTVQESLTCDQIEAFPNDGVHREAYSYTYKPVLLS